MKQQEGFVVNGKKELPYKIKESWYGFKQSPRLGYKKFVLLYWDLVYQEATIIIVYSKQIGGYFIYVVLYVDDFFSIGNNK